MNDDLRPRRRPRFSLLNLLVVVTIASLAIGLWRANSLLAPMRAELAELRNETGRLIVDDPERLHAIRVESGEFDLWKFRVWIPEGEEFWIGYATSKIPPAELPKFTRGGTVKPGEHLIELRLRTASKNGDRLMLLIAIDGKPYLQTRAKERDLDWINNEEVGGQIAERYVLDREAVSQPADEPLVLYRLRAQEVANVERDPASGKLSYTKVSIDGPTEGAMVWIQRNPRRGSDE